MTELASLSAAAQPTAFHLFLKSLDQQARLLRCYTQNIDGLEARTGLSVGIPSRSKGKRRRVEKSKNQSASGDCQLGSDPPSKATPRCIPLHGQLSTLHCPICSIRLPLTPYLPLPPEPIPCPSCTLNATIRHALSERQRRIGSLRASVVLYGEDHSQAESIGALVERDIKEGKIDFLLVAGTSLAIPGVKRIIKEIARGLHSRRGKELKVIYVNDSPPAKMTEWDKVFDVWVQGDVQRFVESYLSPPEPMIFTPEKAKASRGEAPLTPMSTPKRHKTGLSKPADKCSSGFITPTRESLVSSYLPTPRTTPPSHERHTRMLEMEPSISPDRRSETDPCSPREKEENPFLNLDRGFTRTMT
ncbi:MAG: hypothetical protein TREMPRED_004026 [Tremellales sp. Tagirdzhanova-0007]|nr:MAG: hypothetical protein TREMPRED_004026 [Tremellales sp. Tagirdzhanova-0007]